MTGRLARLVAAAGVGVVLSGGLIAGAQAAPAAPAGSVQVAESLAAIVFNSSPNADRQHKIIPIMRHDLGGKTAYCVDWADSVFGGANYNESADTALTPPNFDAVKAVLENGFGANTAEEVLAAAGVTDLGGVSTKDLESVAYAATQAAIWHTAFPAEFTLRVPDSVDDQQVKDLAKAFPNFQAEAQGTFNAESWLAHIKLVRAIYVFLTGKLGAPALTITPATGTGQVGSKIGPFTVNSHRVKPATVTGSTGGTLLDKDGKAVTTLGNGGQFWVDCKAEGTVTITATATTKTLTVKLWTGTFGRNNANRLQTLATVTTAEKQLTANATATCTAIPTVPSLPVTGAPVIGTIAAGVVLLLVGGGLFLVRRRRRIRFTA